MGSKTRLSSYCTKRVNNCVDLATSRKIITRLARPIATRGPKLTAVTQCSGLRTPDSKFLIEES